MRALANTPVLYKAFLWYKAKHLTTQYNRSMTYNLIEIPAELVTINLGFPLD